MCLRVLLNVLIVLLGYEFLMMAGIAAVAPQEKKSGVTRSRRLEINADVCLGEGCC